MVNYKDVFLFALEWKLRFTTIEKTSPAAGEGGVAITRETILRFDRPLETATINSDSIYAKFAGAKLAARLHVGPDQDTVTLFYEENLPPSSLVRVTVDGDLLKDFEGKGVDADGDRREGGIGTFDFETLTLSTIPGTAVFGRVFASEFSTAKGTTQEVNVPLEGVRITVDGMEDIWNTTTDNMGNFTLDPAPAGRFFVHIDGRTVQSASIDGVVTDTTFPDGPYYPFVGKAWQSVPGESATVGDIHLPLVLEGALQPVSQSEDTVIGLTDDVIAINPELFDGIAITIPADSLYANDGTRGGRVGLGVVPPDRLPGTLPPGLDFPVVITVQASAATEEGPLPTNFDVPAPVCFPNLPLPHTGEPLPPNSKSALWSFDHDKGFFEVVGSMTVSPDGQTICTDEGVGVLAPGWHASLPGTSGSGGDTGMSSSGGGDDDDDDMTGGGDDDDDDDDMTGDDDDDDVCGKGVNCGDDDDDDMTGDDDDDDDDDDGGGGGGGCGTIDCGNFEILAPALDLYVDERITWETKISNCATGEFTWIADFGSPD
ncbi:MAG: Ig-like domain-containing protein, partial [Candidatus Omnitrophica bacterium]|nr:Ig-like domain-containing protein [Candidatus Omnitrophota bacterium]